MATTRTRKGSYLKLVSTTTSTDVPTLPTHGLPLQDLGGLRFVISADQGATLSGTGAIEFYIYDPSIGKIQASETAAWSGAPTANDTFTINGVVFTAKASAAADGEFTIGGSVTATGDNFVTAFNAYENPTLAGLQVVNNAGTITISAIPGGQYDGTAGNAVTLAESMANFTINGSATELSGGLEARWVFVPELTINLSTLTGVSGKRAIGIADYEVLAPRGAFLEARCNTVATSAGGITNYHLGHVCGGVYNSNSPLP
jgi:hypothetical protein